METNEIIEGNKLIAEFMELASRDAIGIEKSNRCTKMFKFENKHIGGWSFTWISDGALEYHSSWDWLMPVVATCLEKVNDDIDNWEWYYENIDDTFFYVDIEQTWIAVVEFVKWYNQSKQP